MRQIYVLVITAGLVLLLSLGYVSYKFFALMYETNKMVKEIEALD